MFQRLVSYRYLIPVNTDALHSFKSRGFGGEIGVALQIHSLRKPTSTVAPLQARQKVPITFFTK